MLTVSVYTLAHHDVFLLVLDALQSRCQLTNFVFHWGNVTLLIFYIKDAVHIESVPSHGQSVRASPATELATKAHVRKNFGTERAHLVREAVRVPSVSLCCECECPRRLLVY